MAAMDSSVHHRLPDEQQHNSPKLLADVMDQSRHGQLCIPACVTLGLSFGDA